MSGDEADRDRPTATPFLLALVIIVVVITAILVITRGEGDGDPQQIGRVVVAQNDALQRQDYEAFKANTCAAKHGTEKEVLDRQRDSVTKHGDRYVDGAGNIAVVGDTATATVKYHFGTADETDTQVSADMMFTREDGQWKVCSQGPA